MSQEVITNVEISDDGDLLLRLESGGRPSFGTPLLRLTRLLYDHDRRPVLHFTAHVSPERSRILMDISANTMNTLAAGHISHDVMAA